MSGVERGPEPVGPLPWRSDTYRDYSDEYVAFIEDANGHHPDIDDEQECAAIVHRVNGWDALLAERDAAIARAERAEALLAETDAFLAGHFRLGPQTPPMVRAAIARHKARKGTP